MPVEDDADRPSRTRAGAVDIPGGKRVETGLAAAAMSWTPAFASTIGIVEVIGGVDGR